MTVLLMSLVLTGCHLRGYVDSQAKVVATRLNLPPAQYRSVAWLTTDQIALAYKAPEDREGTTRVALLDLKTGRLEDIILPSHPESCFPVPSGISGLSRLPNSNLGYIYFCFGNPGGLSGELNEWDRTTGEIRTLVHYPDFGPSNYSVSPDMSVVLQENAVGAILANELHRFQIGGEGERILVDFTRAGSPSWAPDGQSFIFAGTKSTPFDAPENFEDIKGLALFPWTLYKLSADQSQLHELLTGLERPFLAWSPDGRQIAIGATYQKKYGTWLLDVDTLELKLIWQGAGVFAWSPDGRAIIVLDPDEKEIDLFSYYTYPTILNLDEVD